MRIQKIEIEAGRNCRSNAIILIDINEIPYPTAIYILSKKEVILNKRAYEVLGMNEGEVFDLATWEKNNPYLNDTIRKLDKDIINDQKMHVVLFNGKHEIMNYSLTRITCPTLGKVCIVHFSKASKKYSAASISSLYSVKEEVAKLNPYLNRTGKIMHESMMKKYFREENQQFTLDEPVYYEKELRIIQEAYPSLSHREVILCGLLVNNMNSKDIASITNRTLDAVFVTIHRINRKLNIANKKKLVETLKAVLNRKESGSTN